MREGSPRWHEVSPSRYPHEREGLDYVRERLPDAHPYFAWSNVELIGSDGTQYEVDLIVLGPGGFHLVELKAWSGTIEGDEYRWLEHNPGAGRPLERRSPLGHTNQKARVFADWLGRQVGRKNVHVPYVHESVFLHGHALKVRLPDHVKAKVFGRDDDTGNGLRRIVADRLTAGSDRGRPVTEAQAKSLHAIISKAGLRGRPREIRVGDWVLDDEVLDSGWGWEDRLASHQVAGTRGRVRRWFTPPGAGPRDAATVQRAAQREYQAFHGLNHPSVVAPHEYHPLDDGSAALVYRHDPSAQPLQQWLAEHGRTLTLDDRLGLVRRLALVVRYAHDHGLVHRQLSPTSVTVSAPGGGEPQVQVKDWQVAGTLEAATATTTRVTLLRHLGTESVYAAPEVASGQAAPRPSADVFSLGALAAFVVSDSPPAPSREALNERLREQDGIDLAATLDGVAETLRLAVQAATHPSVANRTDTVVDFVNDLDDAIDELRATEGQPPEPTDVDPLTAGSNDLLAGRFLVDKVLGEGSTSVALLVATDDATGVLKVARDDAKGARMDDEADALRQLTGTDLVAQLLDEPLTIGGRRCLFVEQAGDRTLADTIRAKGRLSLDQLARFGRDLLSAVALLEDRGLVHRDVKPANLGIRPRAADGSPHLVLFDFSLAGADPRDVQAGTVGYRDWFLGRDGRHRFDLAAELFSVAVTLHEMATGELPVWGDGQSDPALLDVEVTVATHRMDPAVADRLTAFFRQALARDLAGRFANPQDMAAAWEQAIVPEQESAADLDARADAATLDTPLPEAGLSAAALSALEQYDLATVRDLLGLDPLEPSRIPGATQATKDEVVKRTKAWRRRLLAAPEPPAQRSLDAVRQRLLGKAPDADTVPGRVVRLMLGLADEQSGAEPLCWPTAQQVDDELAVGRKQVSAAWQEFREAVSGTGDVAGLRDDVLAALATLGGVAGATELAHALLDRRGSSQTGTARDALGQACVRLAVETTDPTAATLLASRRTGAVLLVAGDQADDASLEQLDDRLAAAAALAPDAQAVARARPMPLPQTVIVRLREQVADTMLADLPDDRLRSLAASAGDVAVSPRGELYPRGMPAVEALSLARTGLLLPVGSLTERMLRQRVQRRFPEAQPLPGRPELDELLRTAGVDLVWDGDAYTAPTGLGRRTGTRTGTWHPGSDAPQKVQRRLDGAVRSADFVALAVASRDADAARARLLADLPLTEVDLTALVLTGMRRVAQQNNADWSAVLAADAPDASPALRDLVAGLAREAADTLGEAIAAAAGPVLLTEPAVLARYGCVDLLAPLSDFTASREHAVLVLVPQAPGTTVPTLDGTALPLGAPTQWLWLPTTWVRPLASTAA